MASKSEIHFMKVLSLHNSLGIFVKYFAKIFTQEEAE